MLPCYDASGFLELWSHRMTAPDSSTDLTQLLRAAEGGDAGARDQVISAVYQELRRLARRILAGDRASHRVAPTELVHGAALKLMAQDRISARDRAHFLAYSGQVMRQVLIDEVRREGAEKRGPTKVTLFSQIADEPQADIDIEALNEALERLAEVSPDHARLVELRYFSGMTVEEIATLDGVSTATVKRNWRAARAWLLDALDSGNTG